MHRREIRAVFVSCVYDCDSVKFSNIAGIQTVHKISVETRLISWDQLF